MKILEYENNKRLQEILQEHTPSELKTVRISLKSKEEYYVLLKEEYDKKVEEEGVPAFYMRGFLGKNPLLKKKVENMVSYLRQSGIPISPDEDTWEALDFPIPDFLIARHVE